MTDRLATDLRERWRPTDEVTEAAARILTEAADGEPVYTAHLLLDKVNGFWTEDVTLLHFPGVYRDREELFRDLAHFARRFRTETGRNVTAGYAIHFKPGEWAAFEMPFDFNKEA